MDTKNMQCECKSDKSDESDDSNEEEKVEMPLKKKKVESFFDGL